ncbi:MAG: hypothetical protein OHM77_02025 [Candidatus Nitricoxidivorans perseverans]|uniref:Carboxypeptidase regulatory-like domain-containing protein n=1 Tax=Candidatus Nitricoxidivorans perseverans TaxID=2975601 RepID=A0AA49FLU1_9PROT|nr:MAG: hypothetical protein OHM77_02025 [Candidatus Nitricoxidivorans perseverans]
MVRLYRSSQPNVTALAVASPKETFAILSDAEVAAKAGRLIAEAVTDSQGGFVFELGDAQKYGGEAFDIDVYCGTVPPRPPRPRPVQFSVTTLQPQWRQAERGRVAAWEYCVPQRNWCAVRARFDAWTICGRVTVCDTRQAVMGVRVLAFDVDWLQDDPLGSAMTDASGHFRIDYSSADFQRTPFSPSINLEWTGGPDVYFRVEAADGTPLLIEPPSRGRTPGRENVGHCLCVDLCLKEPPRQNLPTIPLFTNVGQYRVDPVYGDFTAAGLTTAGDYAFTDTIPLIGILPDGQAPADMEYRFRVAEYDATATILGAVMDVDASMVSATIIGKLQYWSWNGALTAWEIKAADYFVNNPGATVNIPQPVGPALTVGVNKDVGPGGWIRVPRENGLFPGGVGRFIPQGGLVNLVTTKLTDESRDLTVPAPGTAAGESVPAGKKSRAHTFKLFFEARDVGALALSPGSNALDKIVFSNTHYTYRRHPAWAGSTPTTRGVVSLDILELSAPGAGCGKLTDALHALFTVYHPFVGGARVYFEGNPVLPAELPLAIVGGEAVSSPAGHLFDISALQPCAYILWLEATLNLTAGWGRIPYATTWDHIAFCKG